MDINETISNLNQYVSDDIVYKKYLKNENLEYNDFEIFCINHCKDIKTLIKAYEQAIGKVDMRGKKQTGGN